MQYILLLSKNPEIYRQLEPCFGADVQISRAENENQAISMLQSRRFEYVFVDINMFSLSENNGGNYRNYIKPFLGLYPTLDVIIITPVEKIREALIAVKEGARDYTLFPVKPDDVCYVLKNAKESQIVRSELDYLRDRFRESDIQLTMRDCQRQDEGCL